MRPSLLPTLTLAVLSFHAIEARAETQRLEVSYRSSHGCSQSFASTSFDGVLVLTVNGKVASLSITGNHSYSMGPSPGRYRASGGKDQTHHTHSTIDLGVTGSVSRSGAALTVKLDRITDRCKTRSGYLHTTQYACRIPTPLTLACRPSTVPVYPVLPTPGSGAFPVTGEKPTLVPVLRCELAGSNLGLLGELRFQSGLPFSRSGLVHYYLKHSYSPFSLLRRTAPVK